MGGLARSGVLVSVLLLAAACGSDDDTGTSGGEATWSKQLLAAVPGADQRTAVGVDGDRMVVVTVSDDGSLTGFVADGDGRFEKGKSAPTGVEGLDLGGVTRVGGRWVAVGSGGQQGDQVAFDLLAYASADGLQWSALDTTGLDGPADVMAVTSIGDSIVAVGALRTGENPAMGPFAPVAWRSDDGVTWSAVELPTGAATGGSARQVAAVGDTLLAVGHVGDRPRAGGLWESADRGASWHLTEQAGAPAVTGWEQLAVQDDVVVLGGSAGDDTVMLRSTDGGGTWQQAEEPPPSPTEHFAPPLSVGGGRFFAVTDTSPEPFSDPKRCYADPTRCHRKQPPMLYVSDDEGDRWTLVDTSSLDELDHVVGTDDGRVVVLNRVGDGTRVWTWPGGTPLRHGTEPVEPDTSDIVMLDEDEAPEVGVRYAEPLYTHCGMEWLFLGTTRWRRSDHGEDVSTGGFIYGYATLVSPDEVEYTDRDGKRIATYERTTEEPPGCA